MNKAVNTIVIDPQFSFWSRITDSEDEHVHDHDFFEIFYISDGSITHCINGGKDELTIGDACLICPNVTHTFKRHGACTHRDFIISRTLAKSVCEFIDAEFFANLKSKGFVKFRINPDDVLFVERTITSFMQNLDISKHKNYEKILTSTLFGFAYLFLHEESNSSLFKSLCIQAITTHLIKKDAIELIRKDLGYNKYYLCKKFKAAFGCTLVEYLNTQKLSQARYLLVTTNYKVAEICDKVGFESTPYFNKLFTAEYGSTPAKYRKNNLLKLHDVK